MKYIKSLNEFFYLDHPVNYSNTSKPSMPSDRFMYSELHDQYYDINDIKVIMAQYYPSDTELTPKLLDNLISMLKSE